MSGGSLGYFYSDLADHHHDLGDKELDELVIDLSELFHAREWYLSSDTCEGSWIEARDAFKQKWFGENTRAERIRKYLEEIRKEVLDAFGISEAYCRNCSHWTAEEDEDSHYGACDLMDCCLMHRSETCDRFEKRGQEDKT